MPSSCINCDLQLDQIFGSYCGGDWIRGDIRLTLTERTKFHLIKVRVIRKAHVHLNKSSFGPSSKVPRSSARQNPNFPISSEEILISQESTIYFERGSNRSKSWLEPGTHLTPFRIQIPNQSPSSFEGQFGWIKYSLEVLHKLSCWDSRILARADFQVNGVLDLNELVPPGGAQGAFEERITQSLSNGRGQVQLDLKLLKTSYVPGDHVLSWALVTNSTRYPLSWVRVYLQQEITYSVKQERIKETRNIVSLRGPVIQPEETRSWSGNFEVPPLPPSGLGVNPGSISINLNYYFLIEIWIFGDSEIKRIIPSLIGTAPSLGNSNLLYPSRLESLPSYFLEPSGSSNENLNEIELSLDMDGVGPPPTYVEVIYGNRCGVIQEGDEVNLNVELSLTSEGQENPPPYFLFRERSET